MTIHFVQTSSSVDFGRTTRLHARVVVTRVPITTRRAVIRYDQLLLVFSSTSRNPPPPPPSSSARRVCSSSADAAHRRTSNLDVEREHRRRAEHDARELGVAQHEARLQPTQQRVERVDRAEQGLCGVATDARVRSADDGVSHSESAGLRCSQTPGAPSSRRRPQLSIGHTSKWPRRSRQTPRPTTH